MNLVHVSERSPVRWLAALLLSLLFSFALAAGIFHLDGRPLLEQLTLVLVPALGLAVLIFWVYPWWEEWYRQSGHRLLILGQALIAALLFVLLTSGSLSLRLAEFGSVLALGFALALPASPGYDYILRRGHVYSLIAATLVGSIPALFIAGFVSHSYPGYLFLLLASISLLGCGMAAYTLIRAARAEAKVQPFSAWTALPVIGLALLFAAGLALLALGYPAIVDAGRFLPPPQDLGLFLALVALSPVWMARGLEFINERGLAQRWSETAAGRFAAENLPGLALGYAFFAAYSVLSFVFNHPGLDQTENYLAADNFAWMDRLASAGGTGIEMRAVHPFAFFILRPLAWLFSLFFNGDRETAVMLLVPLTGGLCVLLAYTFMRRWSGSAVYALLVSAILGASASHVLFGSIVESYIFSAFVLLLFFLLLLEPRTHWMALAAVGVVTFGITITNFIQTFIGFMAARPRLKAIFLYGLLASALAITLTALHAAVFPSALAFYDPAGAGVESEYAIPVFGQPVWRVTGRMVLLAREILLYSMVAPRPFALTTEVGGTFPRFNFFRLTPGHFAFSSYAGLGRITLLLWVVLLAAAGLLFVWRAARLRRMDVTTAFPLVILFNFLLHLGYGYEPFLYSADWTYALVLFVGTSLSPLGRRAWFRFALIGFLALLMWNQWQFIRTMLEAIAPFFGR